MATRPTLSLHPVTSPLPNGIEWDSEAQPQAVSSPPKIEWLDNLPADQQLAAAGEITPAAAQLQAAGEERPGIQPLPQKEQEQSPGMSWGGKALEAGKNLPGSIVEFAKSGYGAVTSALPAAVAVHFDDNNPRARQTWADEKIEQHEQRSVARAKEPGSEKLVTPPIPFIAPEGIKAKDLREFESNAGMMMTAMGASLLGRAWGGVVGGGSALLATAETGPGAIPATASGVAVGQALGSMAGAGYVGYKYDQNQFSRQLLAKLDQELGRKATPEEAEVLLQTQKEAVHRHALAEGVWEGVGTTVEMAVAGKIFKEAAVKKVGGQYFKKIAKVVAGGLANLGLEWSTEIATQIEQHNAEIDAGLAQGEKWSITNPEHVAMAGEEVGPAVVLTSGIMSGGAAAGGYVSGKVKARQYVNAEKTLKSQGASQDDRLKAAKVIYSALKDDRPEDAGKFHEVVAEDILANRPTHDISPGTISARYLNKQDTANRDYQNRKANPNIDQEFSEYQPEVPGAAPQLARYSDQELTDALAGLKAAPEEDTAALQAVVSAELERRKVKPPKAVSEFQNSVSESSLDGSGFAAHGGVVGSDIAVGNDLINKNIAKGMAEYNPEAPGAHSRFARDQYLLDYASKRLAQLEPLSNLPEREQKELAFLQANATDIPALRLAYRNGNQPQSVAAPEATPAAGPEHQGVVGGVGAPVLSQEAILDTLDKDGIITINRTPRTIIRPGFQAVKDSAPAAISIPDQDTATKAKLRLSRMQKSGFDVAGYSVVPVAGGKFNIAKTVSVPKAAQPLITAGEASEIEIPRAELSRMRTEAESEVDALPVYKHMAEARRTGLNMSLIKKDYDKNSLKDIPGYQKMFAKSGKAHPDSFAGELGYDSLDHMIETFKRAKPKYVAIADVVRGKKDEWTSWNMAAGAAADSETPGPLGDANIYDIEAGLQADERDILGAEIWSEIKEEVSSRENVYTTDEWIEFITDMAKARVAFLAGSENNRPAAQTQKEARNEDVSTDQGAIRQAEPDAGRGGGASDIPGGQQPGVERQKGSHEAGDEGQVREIEPARPAVPVRANTVFTEDAAAKARAILRAKLGQLNSGVDPEMMQAGITLAGYHIEKGARSFSAYAKAMVEDLGDLIKPYLKSYYMALKYDPRAAGFVSEMDGEGVVARYDFDATAQGQAFPTSNTGDADGQGQKEVLKESPDASGVVEPSAPSGDTSKFVTDAPEVSHVTKKGKTLRGVIATGLTKEQAEVIDPATWRKDGGYFIRMKYVERPGEKAVVEQHPASDGAAKVDEAAHKAATSPQNDKSEPTVAQKEAGNYAKGHITIHGMDITVENPAGSQRSNLDRDKLEEIKDQAWKQEVLDKSGVPAQFVNSAISQAGEGNYREAISKLNQAKAQALRAGERGLASIISSFVKDIWAVTMPPGVHYGYIKRTEGADGDHVDVFVGPNPELATAFIINQKSANDGKFDEHKVMLGFKDREAAKSAYLKSFEPGFGENVFQSMTGDIQVGGLKAQLPKLINSRPVAVKATNAPPVLSTENDKTGDKTGDKTTPTREQIAQRYADILKEKRGHDGAILDNHLRVADAILAKDAYGLEHLANGLNDSGKQVFSEFTGIKLPKQLGETWKVIRKWAGVTDEQDAANQALKHLVAMEKSLTFDLGKEKMASFKADVEKRFAEGFTEIRKVANKLLLVNPLSSSLINLSQKGYAQTQPFVKAHIAYLAAKKALDAQGESVTLVSKSLQTGKTEEIEVAKIPDKGQSHAQGVADFKAGKPRILPNSYTDKAGVNAKLWYAGWDAANVAAPVASDPVSKGDELAARLAGARRKLERTGVWRDEATGTDWKLQALEDGRGYYWQRIQNGARSEKGGGMSPWSHDKALDLLMDEIRFDLEGQAVDTAPPTHTVKDKLSDRSTAKHLGTALDVAEWLRDGVKITPKMLFDSADKSFGGTQAEGKYSVKDAYDAMELGVNQYLSKADLYNGTDVEQAVAQINKLAALLDLLPTQTKRTAEQDEFQQFSTPPTLAYLANWVANIGSSDVALEPSAGIGGLAVIARSFGATTIVNELSERRRAILRHMGFGEVFGENAEQLNNILPERVKPTVVIMNPPFSSSAGRLAGSRSTMYGATHVEQALKRLEPGGRLVAIVGQGMSDEAPAFRNWWAKIKGEYRVVANLEMNGEGYKKYGTTFDNRILVIDKTGPTADNIVKGRAENFEEAARAIAEVRNERVPAGELPTVQPAVEAGIGGSASDTASGRPVLPATGGMVAGSGRTGDAGGVRPVPTQRPSNDREAADGGAGEPGGRGTDAAATRPANEPGGDGQENLEPIGDAVSGDLLTVSAEEGKKFSSSDDSVFEPYAPSIKVAGAKPHPADLVESAAMAAVDFPAATYRPNLPASMIESGAISEVQLESVVGAGEQHKSIMPNGERRGFFIGDGTGVGKGRTIAAIVMDNFQQGRTKAVWVSKNGKLFTDAQRDMAGIGWDKSLLTKFPKEGDILRSKGTLFSTYSLLTRGKRVSALHKWLGPDFDGVIVFDEAHMMGNAIRMKGKRGYVEPSQTALAAMDLQKQFPKARVVYVSATGATEVRNLAYAHRLGLWGEGTAFPNAESFVNDISAGGIAAMEIVARDLKASGKYLARKLAYNGEDKAYQVTYERLEHTLTDDEREMYDALARGWQLVLNNINEALKVTGANLSGKAKGAAYGAFWGAHQRFFNQVITSIQMSSVIGAVERDMQAGMSSVLQITSTNEAGLNNALSGGSALEDLEDLDLTPREQIVQMIENSFPVQAYEAYTDDDGNKRSRPVVDSEGNPVLDKDAVLLKEKMLNEVSSFRMQEGPLERLLNHFGADKVAEVTGRSKRIVRADEGNGLETVKQSWSQAKSLADAAHFMSGKKRILVFSEAGGTGASYHAAKDAKNQQQRRHYLVQPGWRADAAMQGMGRTHRSNQVAAPVYVMVTTDLKGQKRFISSIARRLAQLGALTEGQRDASSQGIFTEGDNLESVHAQEALRVLISDINHGGVGRFSLREFAEQMGFAKLVNEQGGLNNNAIPDIPQFMNRILSLEVEMQNDLFDMFTERFNKILDAARDRGELNSGMETVRARSVDVISKQVVFQDKSSAAKTEYVQLDVERDRYVIDFQSSKQFAHTGYYRNVRSGRVWAVGKMVTRTEKSGRMVDSYPSRNPNDTREHLEPEALNDPARYEKLSQAASKGAWDDDYAQVPKTVTTREHLITGAMLPIWDRLSGSPRIVRIRASNGEQLLGRLIDKEHIAGVVSKLGASLSENKISAQQAFDRALHDGEKIELANGWKIHRKTVSGDHRLELIGPDYRHDVELERAGVFKERIQYQTRYFIPTGDNGAGALGRIVESRPIVSVKGERASLAGGPTFARKVDNTSGKVENEISEDQSAAQSLNRGMARYFKNDEWLNAYAQNKLHDSLSGIREAVASGFDKELVGITATDERFDIFNGINYGGKFYINLNSSVGFINITGHELYHQIEKDRPDLHSWFVEQARKHFQNFPEYQRKLNASIKPGESPYSIQAGESELLADFTGDAIADPVFLDQLAKGNPGKFRQLLNAVVKWLDQVRGRFLRKGLGSSKYFSDVNKLRQHLATVLEAYAEGKSVGEISRPIFSVEKAATVKESLTVGYVADSWKMVGDHSEDVRGWLSSFRSQIPDKDAGIIDRYTSIPSWLADKFPEMAKVQQVIDDRVFNRNVTRHTFTTELLDAWEGMTDSDKEAVGEALWLGDEKKVQYGHGDAKFDTLSSAGQKAFTATRQVLNDIRDTEMPNLMQHIGAPHTLIESFRRDIGRITGYMPHDREGRYRYRVFDQETGLIWAEHFDDVVKTLTGGVLGGKEHLVRRRLQRRFPGAKIEAEMVEKPLSEDAYFDASSRATEELINAAMQKLDDPIAFKEAMSAAVADTLKVRGFMAHGISRAGTPGYDKSNWQDSVLRYVSGWAGYKSKTMAMHDLFKVWSKIDWKGKQGLRDYADTYIRDVFENQTAVDRAIDNTRAWLFRKFLSGVVKSAMVNMTQNYMAVIPRLTAETGWAALKVQHEMNKAAWDVLKTIGGNPYTWGDRRLAEQTRRLTAEENRGLTRARMNGAVSDQLTQELLGRQLGKYGTVLRGLDKALGWMFSAAEVFNRETAYLSAFRIGKEKGMSFEEAAPFAEKIISQTHFTYGRENLPPFARGNMKIGRAPYSMRHYGRNMLHLWNALLTRHGVMGRVGFAQSILALLFFGGAGGWPFKDEFNKLYLRLTGRDMFDDLRDLAGKYSRWAMFGVPGGFGVDITGSLGTDMPKNAWELAGAFGSLAKDAMTMAEDLGDRDYQRAAEDSPFTPSVVKGPMVAYRMSTRGQETRSGSKIIDDDMNEVKFSRLEAAQKSLGFQPVRMSENFAGKESRDIVKRMWLARKDRLTRRFKKAMSSGENIDPLIDEMIEFNAKAPVLVSPFTGESLRSSLRPVGPSRRDLAYEEEAE